MPKPTRSKPTRVTPVKVESTAIEPPRSWGRDLVTNFILPGSVYTAQGIATDAGTFGSWFWDRMANGEFNDAQKGALLANLIAAGSMAATHFGGSRAINRYGRGLTPGKRLGAELLNLIGTGIGGEYVMTSGVAQKYIGAATAENARSVAENTEAQKWVASAMRDIANATTQNTETFADMAEAMRTNAAANRDLVNSQVNLNNLEEARMENGLRIAELGEASSRNAVESSNKQVEAANIQAAAAKYLPYAITGIGSIGLLLAGLGISKYLRSKPAKPQGSIRIKMPGKKGDPESTAEVELPLNMPKMSPSLVEGLDRAVRLRTRKNIRANSYKKDPETGKLIPYDEWEEKYGKNGEKLKNPPTDSPLAKGYGASDTMPNSGLPKAASLFDNTENTGAAANTVALYFLGKQFGSSLNNATGKHLSDRGAKTVAGLLAALAPSLIGHIAGELLPARSVSDQIVHDSQGHGILNYTLPGYAAYQAARRSKAYAIENQSKNALGIQENQSNKTNKSYDDDDDDYDWDKEASMQPSMRTGQRKQPEGTPVHPGMNSPAPESIPEQDMRKVINKGQNIQNKLNARSFYGRSIPNY